MKYLKKSQSIVYIAKASMASFLLGVGWRSFFSTHLEASTVTVICLGLLIVSKYCKQMRIPLIIIACLLLGILRLQLSELNNFEKKQIAERYNTYISVTGIVVAQPDRRVNQIKITILDESNRLGKILISTQRYSEYQFGDIVEVSCMLRQPEAFNGFAYDRYLAKEDIYSTCSFPKIKKIGESNKLVYVTGRKIFELKDTLHQVVEKNLPHQHASIVSAMIFALRRDIPTEIISDFQSTGTSHVIAISGLHITIIAALIMHIAMLAGVPRPKTLIVVVFCLLLYLIVIGFPASASRASLMAVAALAAYALGRQYHPWYTLLLVATILVALNPKILRDDIGFQLSFSAVAGIMLLTKPIQQYVSWLPKSMQSVVAMTCAAQVATAPLSLYYFDFVSLSAPLANLIIIPLIPLIIIVSGVALVIELLGVSATVAWYVCWFFVEAMIKVTKFISLL